MTVDNWMLWSLKKVYRKNNYESVIKEFESLDIDLSRQYTENGRMNPYRWYKLNNQHCFQTLFTARMLRKYINGKVLNLVDIGDSAGTHLKKIGLLMAGETGGGGKLMV